MEPRKPPVVRITGIRPGGVSPKPSRAELEAKIKFGENLRVKRYEELKDLKRKGVAPEVIAEKEQEIQRLESELRKAKASLATTPHPSHGVRPR